MNDSIESECSSGRSSSAYVQKHWRLGLNLDIPAKQARQIAQDLERAGLLLPVDLDGAEAYVLRSMMSHPM